MELLDNSNRYCAIVRTWLCGGLFLFVVGYFVFPTSNAQKTWFYLGVLLPVLLLLPAINWRLLLSARQYYLLVVFICYLWVTQFWSMQFDAHDVVAYSKRILLIFALLIAAVLVQHRYARFQTYLLLGFFLFGVAAALIELWHYFGREPFHWRVLIPDPDRFANQNRAAKVYGVVVVLGISIPFLQHDKRYSLLALMGIIPAVAVVVLTRSSSALAALLAVILLAPLALSVSRKKVALLLLFCAVMAILMYLFGLSEWFLAQGWSKRDVIWLSVLSEAGDNLWFGQGIRSDTSVLAEGRGYGHEHNFVLAVLRYGGLVGIGLLAAVFLQAMLRGLRGHSPYSRLWLLILVYGCVALLTSGKYPLSRPNESWLLFWIPLALLWVPDCQRLPEAEGQPDNRYATERS